MTNDVTRSRSRLFDVVKGLGIVLVFLGHSIVYGSHSFRTIFLFHMPLFFLVSGVFFKPEKIVSLSSLLSKIGKNLLLPLVYFSIIGLAVLAVTGDFPRFPRNASELEAFYVSTVNDQSIGGLVSAWFIACLAIAQLSYCLVYRLVSKLRCQRIFVPLVLCMFVCACRITDCDGYLKHVVPFKLLSVPVAMCYFAVGHLFSAAFRRLESREAGVAGLALSCALPFAVVVYLARIGKVVTNLAVPVYPEWWLLLLGSACGICAVFSLSMVLVRVRPIAAVLGFVGCNSLGFFMLESHSTRFTLAVLRCFKGDLPHNPMASQMPFVAVLCLVAMNLALIALLTPALVKGLAWLKGLFSEPWQLQPGPACAFSSRRRWAAVCSAACLVLGLVCIVSANSFVGKDKKRLVEGVSYEFQEGRRGTDVELGIVNCTRASLKFDCTAYDGRTAAETVFHTADSESGIALEVGADGTAVVLFPSGGSEGGRNSEVLGVLACGESHSIAVEYRRGRMSVSVDGVDKVAMPCVPPSLGGLTFGSRADGTGAFHGRICGASVWAKGASGSKGASRVASAGTALLALALAFACFCVEYSHRGFGNA